MSRRYRAPRRGIPFMDEYLMSVISPKLHAVILSNPQIATRAALHAAFCKNNQADVSRTTFDGWLKRLGVTFTARLDVRLGSHKFNPGPRVLGPSPEGPLAIPPADLEAPIKFDTPEPSPAPGPQPPATLDEARMKAIAMSLAINPNTPDIAPMR